MAPFFLSRHTTAAREILAVSSDPSSWKESQAPYNPGPITNFQRGYKVRDAGRHENSDQYRAFQYYMNMGAGRSMAATAEFAGVVEATVSSWAKTYNWDKRVAHWDKQQMALTFKEANKLERSRHRKAIEDFRQTNEDQARLMMDVSSDLMNIVQERLHEAQDSGEKIPMGLLSGLIRAAANISDSGRQAWATSLGVNELMQVVDQELDEVQVSLIDEDVYDIPLDE